MPASERAAPEPRDPGVTGFRLPRNRAPPYRDAHAMEAPDDAPTPARRVTLGDVARAAGVGVMTVSRALRNQPRVAARTRALVLSTAERLGYRPDPALSALVRYRHARQPRPIHAAFAWLNPWPEPAHLRRYRDFDLYWSGALEAAGRRGFRLEEFAVDPESPERSAAVLRARGIRGVLLPPGPLAQAWVKRFPWDDFSVVNLSARPELPAMHLVTADQCRNARTAWHRLVELGYRRIGYAGTLWAENQTGAGVLWAQHWCEELPRLPLCALTEDQAASMPLLADWLRIQRPDAVLTNLAALPTWLRRLGVRVPRDLALASTTIIDCPIPAGIHQNPEEIGRAAALTLDSLLSDNDNGLPAVGRHLLIEGTWVDGPTAPGRPRTPHPPRSSPS